MDQGYDLYLIMSSSKTYKSAFIRLSERIFHKLCPTNGQFPLDVDSGLSFEATGRLFYTEIGYNLTTPHS